MKTGDRIGAMLEPSGTTAYLIGYGIIVGDEVPPHEVSDSYARNLTKTKKLLLDDGVTVYGCECVWGPEEQIKKRLRFYQVIETVDIKQRRGGRK